MSPSSRFFFFFNDTATTEIYTLSLHDALPISPLDDRQRTPGERGLDPHDRLGMLRGESLGLPGDRKSTRLNSSHGYISYAVFCLKKKKKKPAPRSSNISITPYHRHTGHSHRPY